MTQQNQILLSEQNHGCALTNLVEIRIPKKFSVLCRMKISWPPVTNFTLKAISVGRSNNQPLIIAGLYRPPSGTQDQAEQICTEVQELVRNHANAPFWLTSDFNLSDISWKHNNIPGNQNALGVNNAFLTLVEDIGLQQMVDFPTRNNATLDLFLTNRSSLINRLNPIPGISDHEALFIDSDVQAKLRRPTCHNIFLWKKVDLEKLQNDNAGFLPVIYFQILNITPY